MASQDARGSILPSVYTRAPQSFSPNAAQQLDLDGVAGLGMLDRVKDFFRGDGSLQSDATKTQLQRGFLWGSEYGHSDIVEYLLENGAEIQAQANTGRLLCIGR